MTMLGVEPAEVELEGRLWEFREALRNELEAARRAASSSAIQLLNGRRIAQVGASHQYLFLVESALNLPDDSPGDLHVAGQRVEATVISIEGLAVTLSVPLNLGEFVPRAALQSDLTFLLRTLITRVEELRDRPNPAGDRLLGEVAPTGEPVGVDFAGLNAEQVKAVASSLGRDTTFIWGPPGTGKTRTIGRIGAELVRRDRSVLVVSHTNAAVDQAILKIADDLGNELVDGKVLRLGEAADPALQERDRLLAKTHIDERGAALAEERGALEGERLEKATRAIEVQRLLAVCEWLPVAAADIAEGYESLEHVHELELTRDQTQQAVSEVEAEAESLRVRAATAREALGDEQRLIAARQVLVQDEPLLSAAVQADAEADRQEREGVELLALSRQHRAEADAATERLEQLRPRMSQERAGLQSTAEELAQLESSIEEATALLERALEVSALVRRWRGLPKPEEQEQLLDSLKHQTMLLTAAHTERRDTLTDLEQEEGSLSAVVEAWGHLPSVAAQEQTVSELQLAAETATTARRDLESRVHSAQAVVDEVREPRAEFERQNGEPPEAAVDRADAVERRLAAARSAAADARKLAGEARSSLEGELDVKLHAVREWGLSTLRSSHAEAVLEELERARLAAGASVAGTDPAQLDTEQRSLNSRIREIDLRLAAIEDELQRVEELVVGDAWVIATTLTRAYKRDSIQKRRFDTVVLDEASMAPIPALWVAASLADANVILVGDFRQLPPIKHADTPLADKWLGTDVFEASGVQADHDANEAPPFFIALQEQFRMHPHISAIPNRFLYQGQLRDATGVELDSRPLGAWYEYNWGYDAPVLLVDTGSLNAWVTSVNNAGRASRLNFLSATVCVDLAEMLLRHDRPEPPDGHARILLGAPYRPQAKLLNLLIREQKLDPDVRAGTAHTFQGSEAPVMIFDLVNDEPHWKVAMFMASRSDDFKRLLNVALTRAQRRLILVGDFDYIAKQGKKAFVRELIDFLRSSYPVVEAADVIPTGLSARAARMQLQVQGGAEEDGRERIVVTQAMFDQALLPDIASAHERVVIFSPFLTSQRVGTLQPQLRGAVERGARVWVITKGGEERRGQLGLYQQIERTLESWGVTVIHKAKMHEKLVFIDDAILWHGSLNPLSFSDTQEIMERRHSRAVVADYEKTLHLPELLAAYDAREAGEQTCPYCLTGEIVAIEGGREPFYWRCVNDDCFTRSIGDPMPKDGMVVCASGGCGLPVHFGFWGEVPHWRCKANPRHRTKIAKSHLRLPKMRELIPARELKKLDKQFGLG